MDANKDSLIIIGAGASGLMAAYLLADSFMVTVLEAQDHLGGRAYTIKKNKTLMETGAEFVHGNLPVTLSLLKEAGIDFHAVEGNMYRYRNGQFIEEREMTEGWDKLMKQMKKLEEDMTIKSFLHKYFPGKQYENLRAEVSSYAEGFDLADVSKASVKTLYDEWRSEDEENYRIPTGYSSMINYLEKQAEKKGAIILKNGPARSVSWHAGAVTVSCKGQMKFTAAKLLVTVPLPILANEDSPAAISFTPSIKSYHRAAKQIGFGHVIKVILEFKEAFWKRDTGFVLSNELFRTWWSQLPNKKPVLTGWVGGPRAKELSLLSDTKLLNEALRSLSAIYLIPVKTLKAALINSIVCNPQKNIFETGGYTYATLRSAAARKVLKTPFRNTLFFAGEGLYEGGSPGTVEAALVSAKEVSALINNKTSDK